MGEYAVTVTVSPKAELRDPEGKAIGDALHALGWPAVTTVHVGRTINFGIAADSLAEAQSQVKEMCETLLVNPAIEDYTISVRDAPESALAESAQIGTSS